MNSVNVNFFCSQRNRQYPTVSKNPPTYPKQHFHIWVPLDVDRIQIDHTLLLQFIGVGVHVQIRPKIPMNTIFFTVPLNLTS